MTRSVSALLRGADVVLNAIEYVFNLPVLKACIQEKVHYADLGGLFHMTRTLMRMHDEVSAAGITAILGMGGTPGVTNVLARAAVDKLDRVESIKVQLGCSDDTPSSSPWLLLILYARYWMSLPNSRRFSRTAYGIRSSH